MDAVNSEFDPPFEIFEPDSWRAPFLFNSPHSGSIYPEAFLKLSRIDVVALRRSEDSFVDEFITGLVPDGFPVARVHFPRSYVDVNREPYELDPRMFNGRLPSFTNSRSMRVAGGLGTIPRVVSDGQEIYRSRIDADVGLLRIDTLYKPYHRALKKVMDKLHQRFGSAVLIDCHSMPSTGLTRDEPRRADVVIGDRYGTSCSPALTAIVEQTFRTMGYSTERNRPYAGGFITEHYGTPGRNQHAIQIELNRAVYMDERKRVRKDDFAAVVAHFRQLAMALADIPARELKVYQSAAE